MPKPGANDPLISCITITVRMSTEATNLVSRGRLRPALKVQGNKFKWPPKPTSVEDVNEWINTRFNSGGPTAASGCLDDNGGRDPPRTAKPVEGVGVWVSTGGGYGSRCVPTFYKNKEQEKR